LAQATSFFNIKPLAPLAFTGAVYRPLRSFIVVVNTYERGMDCSGFVGTAVHGNCFSLNNFLVGPRGISQIDVGLRYDVNPRKKW
jgi:hypothetical protein